MAFKCPDCGKPLEKVRQSATSPLNAEQFDAMKAGDFFCDACPSNERGNAQLRYFWKRELLGQCQHENFAASVTVNRLQDSGRFVADVRVTCADCSLPFRFIGLPCGVDLNGAAVSIDGTEARLCIAPKGEVVTPLESTACSGFTVRKVK